MFVWSKFNPILIGIHQRNNPILKIYHFIHMPRGSSLYIDFIRERATTKP